MPARATFKGYIRLSLVSVPVKAFTATQSSADIRLNQLHAECNNRVRYVKTCPVHGDLESDEIVKGYEYTKGQYVVVDPDEVSKLRAKSDKAIEIAGFISQDELEPMYFSGRTYYLLPDGPVGQKAYNLLLKSMVDKELFAIASHVTGGREHMVAIRPINGVLGMSVLSYYDSLKEVGQFAEEVEETDVSPEELNLTQTLIAASTLEDFDFAQYKDPYTEQLGELIQMKIEGQEVVAAPEEEEPKVINLMDALKASVESAKARETGEEAVGKMAPSTTERQERKKKTG